MKRVGTFSVIFVLSMGIYLLIVQSFQAVNLIAGAVISILAAAFTFTRVSAGAKYLNPVRWFWFIVYVPVFLKEMLVANLRIALIVLNPKLPVHPELKTDKTMLKTPEGILMLTSSITLTPGTLSVEANGEEITIHCVNTKLSAREIMEPFEKFIVRITE